MEQRENEAAIGCYERVYKTVLTQEVSGEAVVPDPMPDVEQLLDTQAEIYIRSRTLGGGRVSLEGSVHCTVLYLGAERTLPQKTELDLPLNIMAEDPLLADADEFTAEVALSSAETRPVNARKLMVRAEIAASITGYKKMQMDFSTQTEDPGALELLKQQATLGYIACVSEKDFVVSEEVRLADNALAERLLLTDEVLGAATSRIEARLNVSPQR
ncbi:MAG: DUF3794 domain-containing protein [Eubacteriales bacterium]|nr:DUF3794 domain-containing protein [Eubacteriales bacterium]